MFKKAIEAMFGRHTHYSTLTGKLGAKNQMREAFQKAWVSDLDIRLVHGQGEEKGEQKLKVTMPGDKKGQRIGILFHLDHDGQNIPIVENSKEV